jgi:integrase
MACPFRGADSKADHLTQAMSLTQTPRQAPGTVRFHQGRWWACLPSIRQPDGTRRRPWYPADPNTEREARRLLTRKLAELDANRLALPSTDTVGGWVKRFLERHDVEPSTLSGYRQALDKRINHPQVGIGGVRLQQLTATRLDEFYLALKRVGYAKATIQQTHRVLSVALKEAVRKGKLAHSPVGEATLPRVRAA